MFKNTRKQGDAGLGIAIAYFTSQGATVSVPLTDSQGYDLIVDIDGLKRVQVRTTTYKTPYGVYQANLSTKGGNRTSVGRVIRFDSTAVDLLFVVTGGGSMYLIPASEVMAKNCINLGEQYERFNVSDEVPVPLSRL